MEKAIDQKGFEGHPRQAPVSQTSRMSGGLKKFVFVHHVVAPLYRPGRLVVCLEASDEIAKQAMRSQKAIKVIDAHERYAAIGHFYAVTKRQCFGKIVNMYDVMEDAEES